MIRLVSIIITVDEMLEMASEIIGNAGAQTTFMDHITITPVAGRCNLHFAHLYQLLTAGK